jgi:hypothetical protein
MRVDSSALSWLRIFANVVLKTVSRPIEARGLCGPRDQHWAVNGPSNNIESVVTCAYVICPHTALHATVACLLSRRTYCMYIVQAHVYVFLGFIEVGHRRTAAPPPRWLCLPFRPSLDSLLTGALSSRRAPYWARPWIIMHMYGCSLPGCHFCRAAVVVMDASRRRAAACTTHVACLLPRSCC